MNTDLRKINASVFQWRINFSIESPKQNLKVKIANKLNNPAHLPLDFNIVNVKGIQGEFIQIHVNHL